MQSEINNAWMTLSEAITHWRPVGEWYYAPDYDRLLRLVKRSGIETQKRGKYLTFRLLDLQAKLIQQHDMKNLLQAGRGDWYTRARAREQERGMR
jgi:hypothetical protein